MRWFMSVLVLVGTTTACSRPADPAASTLTHPSAAGTRPARQPEAPGRSGAPQRFPAINPITPVQGRVTFVNPKFRFVIVDFTFHQMPRLEQRLGVYRGGERVGEVRISGPAEGPAIVADIMMGTASLGDLVRED